MPPDTPTHRSGSAPDTIHLLKLQQTPGANPPKEWKENIFFPLIVTLGAMLIGFLAKRAFDRYMRRSKRIVKLVSISEKTAEANSKNFIPNHFKILDHTGRELQLVEGNSMDYFISNILTDEYSFYLLIAPTGVGKTTYLLNAYLHYKRQLKKPASLYMGRASDKNFIAEVDQIIKDRKAADTILLIDGLDEFEIKASSAVEFWDKFIKEWDDYKNKLLQFKKVIVSVREQFLQYRDIEKIKIVYDTGVTLSRQLKLLPFTTEEQRELYLEKRYAGHTLTYREHLKWLAFKFDEKGLDFIQLPLVLNFMEDIWSAFEKEKNRLDIFFQANSNFFSLYNLLKIIEQAWLKREAVSKGFDERQIESIRQFCLNLACHIARSGQNTMVTGDMLVNLESTLPVLRQFDGAGDRSLLIKEKGRTEAEDRYGFIHNYFLELFLIQYISDQQETVTDIRFSKYQLTVDVITKLRWEKIRGECPQMKSEYNVDHYEPTATELADLAAWFDKLFYNEEVKKMLDEKCEYYNVLQRQEPEWYRYFPPIYGLKISNNNFWDEREQKPFSKSLRAIWLFRPFILYVELVDIPVQDQHVKAFGGLRNLEWLHLEKTKLTSTGVGEFWRSAPELKTLILRFEYFDDDALQHFQEATQISYLGLTGNRFTSKGLGYLSGCAPCLEYLYLDLNEIDDSGLVYFENSNKINSLGLRVNNFTHSCLRYFANSIPSVTWLDVSQIPISDEDLLDLPDFECLESLFIPGTRVKGPGLRVFSKSCTTLGFIDISENDIADPDLEVFMETDKLQHLVLQDLKITGSCLSHFSKNDNTLEYLYLSNNPLLNTDNLSAFSSFKKLHRLHLAGLNLTNADLAHFSNSTGSLHEIDISNNPEISDLSFAISCPQLKKLNIINCPQITEQQIGILRRRKVNVVLEAELEE